MDPLLASRPAPTAAAPDGGRAGARALVVVGLLFLLMVVNFATKVVPALSGDPLMHELRIDSSAFGVVQSSFFWLFAVGSITGGWLATRYSPRWLLAASALLWALAMAPMAWHVSLGTLIACRVLLGLAEGPTVALALQIAHSWFPAERRALPSAVIIAGAAVGPLVSAPVLNSLIQHHSWHLAFGTLAAVGALVALAWAAFGRDGSLQEHEGHADGSAVFGQGLPRRAPVRRVLTTRTLVALTVLALVCYADTAVKLSWLPLYFHNGLGYSTATAAKLTALPFLAAALALIGFGALSRSLTRRGRSLRATRGVLPGALVTVGGLAGLLFPLAGKGPVLLLLVTLSAAFVGAGYGNAFAGLSDVVPPAQRGLALGVVTAVYSLGGIVGPAVAGALVNGQKNRLGGYTESFVGLGAAVLIGGMLALALADPERDAARLRERALEAEATEAGAGATEVAPTEARSAD